MIFLQQKYYKNTFFILKEKQYIIYYWYIKWGVISMKKFLHYFLIVPIIFIAIFTLFACGDDDIKSIKLSISTKSEMVEEIDDIYYIYKSRDESGDNGKRVPLKVEIEPNNYTVNSLKFDINNLYGKNVVEEVRIRDNNTFIMFGDGSGQCNITASYTRKDKIKISTTLKLIVADETNSNLKFEEETYVTTYTGEHLEDNYKVIGDELGDQNFVYTYQRINTDKNNSLTDVDEIVNVGKYLITCTNPEVEGEIAETILNVKKYKFTLTAGNYEAFYGDSLPEDLFYEGDVPSNVIASTTSTQIVYGIGKDSSKSVGRMVEVTSSNRGTGVGLYSTTIKMNLFSEYTQNYETSFDVNEGSFRILPKEVVLKVKNQTSTYGDNVRKLFELYSYSEYLENEKDITKCSTLDNSSTDYTKDVSPGDVVYKLNGAVATRNSAGQLDVIITQKPNSDIREYGSYDVEFSNATTGRNLILKEVLNGTLLVSPRGVSILPSINQNKTYGEEDPETFTYNVVQGSVINHDNITPFLSIKYKTITEGEYGEGNKFANAGKYYYLVDDTLNPNYDFLLDERALEEGNIPEEERVTFEIRPCEISIKLKDKVERYKTPTGIALSGQKLHTVGYFGTAEDYKLELESVKIGGIEADITTVEDGEVGQKGRINLLNGGRFYFEITITPTENNNYFLSYVTNMARWQPIDGAEAINYTVTWQSSTLNLTKSKVTILPNPNINFKKTYDATTEDADILKNDLGSYYSAVDESGNSVNLSDIVTDATNLLTIIKDDAYYKLNQDGTYERVEAFKNVGKYKIYLNEEVIEYKENMEYYQLELDSSKDYNYEIVQASVSISALIGQNKVYGAEDPILRFEYSNLPNNDEPEILGELSRTSGENVGDYEINLGTLSFGENYKLQLNANLAMFKITPRNITVKPYSYSYVYGERDIAPLYNFVIEDGYDRNILVSPEFTGSFTIVSNKDDADSVVTRDGAGFYPVKLNSDGNVESYSIAIGSFACKTNNYLINFIDTETFTITKKQIKFNITSQQKEDLSKVETDWFTLPKEYYTVTGLVGNVDTTLQLLLNASNNYYCDVNDFELGLTLNGNNVENNYTIEKGANVVYRINMAIVYLSIVNKELIEAETSVETSSYEATFKNEKFEDIFKLISKTSNYEIDYENSKFRFIYRSSTYNGEEPIDAGSYVASLDLSKEGDQLVIINKNAQTEENKKIIFNKETFETMQGNAVISIASLGYLNIKKAQIKIVNDPEFESDFVYESTYLPRLRVATQYENHAIFEGVNGERIDLREFDVNDADGNLLTRLNYIGSGYSISSFQANYTYNIMVSVQKVKNGKIDSNYETLVIPAVPLRVVPKQMNINSSEFNMRNEGADIKNIVYDGSLKSLSLSLVLDYNTKANYTTTYSYQRLQVTYGDATKIDATAKISYRDYYPNDANKFGNTVNQMLFSTLQETTIFSFEIKEDSGTRYVIINQTYAVIMQSGGGSGVTPDSAGVYICIATCSAYENYTFSVNNYGTLNTNTSVQYMAVFEIKKSDNINFTIKKDWSFYYSTRFDFKNQSSLPFNEKDKDTGVEIYYSITPSFLKQNLVISLPNYDGLSTSGYLNVGTYVATLTINTDNYFWTQEVQFVIEKLRVDFVFPVLKNYVYAGQNVPVTSFLSNIRVVRMKEGGASESFFYDPNNSTMKDIVLSYYHNEPDNKSEVTNEIGEKIIPFDIGNYKLRMVCGSEDVSSKENYYGAGEFEYSIIPRTFTGSVRVDHATITYDPLYKHKAFYDLIMERMFTIDLESGYDVTMYIGTYPKGTTPPESRIIDLEKYKDFDYDNITSPEQLGWLKELNNNGQHGITFIVDFDDDKIESVQGNAILTVKKRTLALDDFDLDVNKTYTYDGFSKYNSIYFGHKLDENPVDPKQRKGILLEPNQKDFSKKLISSNGTYVYHYSYEKTDKDEYVTISDNMFNVIFQVRHSYETSNGINLGSVAPIIPGTGYKVYYDITGGANYMTTGLGRPFNTFNIEKITTLYISIKDLSFLNLKYDNGNDLLSKDDRNLRTLGEELLINLVFIRRDDSTSTEKDVYYTLFYNDNYLSAYGVYINIFFKNSKGEIVENIIEAGTYTMNLAIAYSSKYNIVDFFDEVKVGKGTSAQTISSKDMLRDGTNDWYLPITSETFVVGEGDPHYNAENYEKVFGFLNIPSPAQVVDGVIEIETNSAEFSIRIIDEMQEEVTLSVSIYRGNRFVDYIPDGETDNVVSGNEQFALQTKDEYNSYCIYKITVYSKNYVPSEIEIRLKAPTE